MNEPLEVDPEQFDEITQSARVPVLVDFWAEVLEQLQVEAFEPSIQRLLKPCEYPRWTLSWSRIRKEKN